MSPLQLGMRFGFPMEEAADGEHGSTVLIDVLAHRPRLPERARSGPRR